MRFEKLLAKAGSLPKAVKSVVLLVGCTTLLELMYKLIGLARLYEARNTSTRKHVTASHGPLLQVQLLQVTTMYLLKSSQLKNLTKGGRHDFVFDAMRNLDQAIAVKRCS